jgi:hypothetical protein
MEMLTIFEIIVSVIRGMHIRYWWESQKERGHWEGQDIGG